VMTDTFTQHRSWLFALAYRMLGTATDAEDVLQDAHLRFSEHGALEREPAAVRQLLHRARAHVVAAKPRFAPSREAHFAILGAFFAAVQTGDVKRVESLLAKDARAVMDGGGQVKTALNIVQGADRVARLFAGLSKKVDPGFHYGVREVNGWPSVVILRAGALVSVTQLETDGAAVFGIAMCMNPEKLAAMSRIRELRRLWGHG
jgi:RNA polymerase sigma-70 factor (ECF subfamily)